MFSAKKMPTSKEEVIAMNTRTIYGRLELPFRRMSQDFGAYGLRTGGPIRLDPFINIDEFLMSQPTFPPHPHAGFSAVTYMLESSPGAFTNRDSLGDEVPIAPGALHWTQAARGMMHEEIPQVPGTICHGLQIFVNLKAEDKLTPPEVFHAEPAEIPEVIFEGAKVRVLAGSFGGKTSPLHKLRTPVTLLDVQLQPGAAVQIPWPSVQNAFALVLGGSGLSGDTELAEHTAVGFEHDGDTVELRAGNAGLHVIVAGGMPIAEPMAMGGPFVMNTPEQIREAEARFRRGEMGYLAPR
jgi:redox-sensitive bicupin YhaK (pirin superfamily)